MRKLIFILVVALLAGVVAPSVAYALPSANVTVTGTPSFIAITNTPNTWTINGLTGSGFMLPSTTYYANNASDVTAPSATVLDAECRFVVTNVSSTVPLDLTVNIPDFAGGDIMTNSDTGSNGPTTFGAYSWCSGMTYSSKVVAKASGSAVMKDEWSGSTLKWGAEIKTRSDAWITGATMTSTMVITATAD